MIKKILKWFKGDRAMLELYKKLVTQSRTPLYYTDIGVEDSVTGRFESIIVQMFLIINRIAKDEGNNSDNIRTLQEAFIMDMDRNLREMGVGDMGVGKKIKAMAAGWFGTAKAYETAISSEDKQHELMQAALVDSLFRDDEAAKSELMAAHVCALSKYLDNLLLEQILSSEFDYPAMCMKSATLIAE